MTAWTAIAASAALAAGASGAVTWAVAARDPGASVPRTGTNGPPLVDNVAGLQAICEANGTDPGSWCTAYLLGSADALQAFGAGGHKAGICATSFQVQDLAPIFVEWSRLNPDAGGFPMMAGVNLALRNAWPCP